MNMAKANLSEASSGASWTAPSRSRGSSGDGAFARQDARENFHAPGQSGVAPALAGLPPQSKIAASSLAVSFQSGRSLAVSLTPWLQPGVKCSQRAMNRFNGLARGAEAVETAGGFSVSNLHRAKATVLMRTGN